ncbi:hypothetical protein EZV62_027079 [Acer yangbiense]|uniref:Fe2OG dioxygenase domain-containing protein n=1 Tax=Acer yangbiense TaxID=1000413 RepID=A0A5C7GT77_9ROSI|nr:hypothetical protein EZV62_027079 [Acer yangbiense]
MGFNYYPPCPQPELVIGFPPHSDFLGLTILLEVNDAQGLQIKKDGMWIPVKSFPNAFIINIRDTLELKRSGFDHHSEIENSDELSLLLHEDFDDELRSEIEDCTRQLHYQLTYKLHQSPLFSCFVADALDGFTLMDGEICPAPSLVTPETPAMFRRISVVDYIKGLFSQKIDGKSYIHSMRIQNEPGMKSN